MFPRLPGLLSTARLIRAAVLTLALGAVACSGDSENAAPIIDTVEAPLLVREHDGAYAIPVTVLFHDNDTEVVTHLRYRLTPGVEGMVDLPAANPTRESAAVIIVVPLSALPDEADDAHSEHGREGGSTVSSLGDEAEDKRGEGADRPGGKGRGRTRVLSLRIVDGRGAESLPQESVITLD